MRKILYFSFLFLLGLLIFGCNEETKTGDPVVEPTPERTPEEVKYFIVTFDVDCVLTTAEVLDGEKISKPVDPVKDGYIFTGWYIGEEEFNFETIVTSDITLVAMFKKANKVITKIEAASSIYNAFKGEGSLADISNKGYIYYDNNKEEISINWDYSLIDLNKEGAYSLKGSIDIPNGYELDSNIANEVYMDINIKPERKVIKEIYELEKFECFMAEKTIEDLPLTCEVLLSDGTKEEILCIWDYRTVNLTEAGEYLLEGKINIPYGYKLDSLVENYVSLDVVIKDYGFYIKEDYKKSREEYYVRDTIRLMLTDNNDKIDEEEYKDIKNVEWTVDHETKAVRSIDQRYLTVIVLDFVEEINIYASFIYKNAQIVTNVFTIKIEKEQFQGIDEDVITVLCDKDDLKYIDNYSDEYIFSEGGKSTQYYQCGMMVGLCGSLSYGYYASNIKFTIYPDEVDTKDEKIDYIINLYKNGTMNFQVIFLDATWIEELVMKKPGLLKEIHKNSFFSSDDTTEYAKELVYYNNKRYGIISNLFHVNMNHYIGLFYNNEEFEKNEISDLNLENATFESFYSWVLETKEKINSEKSLLSNDIELFTKMLINWHGYKLEECPDEVLKEVFEYVNRLNEIGAFGEDAIFQYQYSSNCNSYFELYNNEKSAKYIVKDKKAFVFTKLKNNQSEKYGDYIWLENNICHNIDFMFNLRQSSGYWKDYLNVGEEIVKDILKAKGITNENAYDILYKEYRVGHPTYYEMYDNGVFKYSKFLTDYLNGEVDIDSFER